MISIDETRCTMCGACLPTCIRRILRKGETSVQVTEPELCLACGHCKAVCPADAPILSDLKEEEFEPVPGREEIPRPDALLRFLRRRRSLRVYRDQKVEAEKLTMMIEAGRFAPTGTNRQPCELAPVGACSATSIASSLRSAGTGRSRSSRRRTLRVVRSTRSTLARSMPRVASSDMVGPPGRTIDRPARRLHFGRDSHGVDGRVASSLDRRDDAPPRPLR